MTARRAGVPRSAWLAAGVAAAAVAAAAGLPPAALCVAGLLGISAGRSGWPVLAGPRGIAVTAASVGIVLLGLRVLAGPSAPPPPGLPDTTSGPWRASVESMSSSLDGSQVARLRLHTAAGEVLVAGNLPPFPVLAAGAEVEVDGRLRPPPDDDPYGEYLRRTGASGSLRASDVRILAPPDGGSLQALRDGAGDALRLALPEPEAGLAAGILIGLRERVDRELAADFATAGASHIVAISGWNIAIVAGLVGAVMRGRPRRLVAVAVGGTIVAYVVAAGASPSVVRAAVMAAVVLAARESGRAGRAAAALGLAAAILLLVDPAMIGDAGFRLSVMATAGLLAWASPLGAWIGRLGGGRVPGWLAESLGISLAAQAATLPDVIATFGRLSLVSPAVNLAVVPLVPVAMAGGVAAMLAGVLVALGAPPFAGMVAGLPGWLVLHVIVALVRVAAGLPFAAIALPPGLAAPAAAIAAVAILGAPMLLRRIRAPGGMGRRTPAPAKPASAAGSSSRRGPTAAQRGVAVAAALVIGVATLALGEAATRSTRLVMLDVGQGDAILVESAGGARMLVDGGPDPDRLLLQLDARIPPWDRRIDVLVLTHPHEDHVAGLVRVLERYRVGRAYEPGMHGSGPGWVAWNAALRDGPPHGSLAAGARILLDEIQLTVLWPSPGTVPQEPAATGRGINRSSVILLGEASGRRFLLTGDAEEDVDPVLVARGLPRLDVLKVAHHGSATATSAELLDITRPSIALISVGADNDYGHPAPSTLARLREAQAELFRTDRDGTIEVTLSPDGVVVHTGGARRSAVTRARWAAVAGTGSIADQGAAHLAVTHLSATRPPLTGYDPSDDHPLALRGRPPAVLPGATRVVPPPRVRRCRRRLVAGAAGRGERSCRGSLAGGGISAPARHRQAARRRSAGRAPPRRGVGGVDGGARVARACGGGPRPPGDTPREAGLQGVDPRGPARGQDRRVRGQACEPAPGAHDRALRVVATPVSRGRLGRRRGRAPGGQGPRTGAGRVLRGCRTTGGRATAPLVPSRPPGCRRVSLDSPVLAYFWGDDGWAVDRAVVSVAKDMERASGAAPDRWRINGRETTPEAIAEHVSTAPMFGGGTLAVVTDPGPLIRSKAGRDAVESLLRIVAAGNALVFVEVGDGRKRAAMLTNLEAAVRKAGGSGRAFAAPKANELPSWIQGRARELGITLENAAAIELARRIGGDAVGGDVDRRAMGAQAVSELEKLALYRLDGAVTLDDVTALVPEIISSSTWDFLDAVGNRNVRIAAPLLDRLLDTVPEPVILAQLGPRVRELLMAADHQAGHGAPADLVKLMGVHPYRVEKADRAARNWTVPELEDALEGVLELDAAVKGVEGAFGTDRQRRLAFAMWLHDHVAVKVATRR